MYEGNEGPPLSMFARIGDAIHVAGHGAVDATGQYTSTDFEGQMRYTMDKLGETLAKAGVTFADVRSVRGYVADPANLPLYNRIYREYFSAPFPARTTITNCLPPGLEFEIDCVAEVKVES